MCDRDVDRPAVELLGGFGAGHRRQPQRRLGGLAGEALGEAPDECHLGIFGHAGGKDGGALSRIEADAEVEGRLDMLDRSRDEGRDLTGTSGRLHAIGSADEQIVGKEASEPSQRVAHRRLR